MTYLANVTAECRTSAGARRSVATFMLGAGCVAGFLAIAGCASAQNAPAESPLAPAATLLRQRTEPPPAADFVRNSRPAAGQTGFIPANAPRAEPQGKPMDRDQIKSEEARLEALLNKHSQISGRKPSTKPGRSAAGDPYVAPVKKKPAKCVLTCEIK